MIMLLLPCLSYASNRPSIKLEGIEVSLGDTKQQVMAKFKDVCHVRETADGDFSMYSNSELDPRYIGLISFKHNMVKTVLKQWSDYPETADSKITFNALYGVINDIAQSSPVTGQIIAKQMSDPDDNKDAVIIQIGHRRVVVMSSYNKLIKRKTIEVYEVLD
jgi:hypothetical protein